CPGPRRRRPVTTTVPLTTGRPRPRGGPVRTVSHRAVTRKRLRERLRRRLRKRLRERLRADARHERRPPGTRPQTACAAPSPFGSPPRSRPSARPTTGRSAFGIVAVVPPVPSYQQEPVMPARPTASRRTVLRGVALTPVVGLGLTACGGADDKPTGLTGPVEPGAGTEVAAGSARLYRDHNVVVNRAEDGTLTAYSTICTHARCPANKLDGDRLICPCHGSEFDVATGKATREPAVAPLDRLAVAVENGRIVARPEA